MADHLIQDTEELENSVGILSPKEREEFDFLNGKINGLKLDLVMAMNEKIDFLRKLFRQRGLIADNLKDLKSKSELQFKRVKFSSFDLAETANGEKAYLCAKIKFGTLRIGCGWVMGKPEMQLGDVHNWIAKSIFFHCRICKRAVDKNLIKDIETMVKKLKPSH